MRKCTKCGVEKPDEKFYHSKHYRGGLAYHCKACMKAVRAVYTKTLKHKICSMSNHHGVDKDRIYELVQSQGMDCYYCGRVMLTHGKRNDVISLDHVVPGNDDHLVLCCMRCNRRKNNLTITDMEHFIEKIREATA